MLHVAVADNGPGIPPDQAAHIFDKFHQVTGQQMGKHAGTGLGLAISRLIVEHHGGTIWVETSVGKGSTFVFTLPSSQVKPMEVAAGAPG